MDWIMQKIVCPSPWQLQKWNIYCKN